jgi:indolepyruvate ferredoxin oxidoreductase
MTAHQDLREVALSDKFEQDDGRIFISGTQALARLALLQRQLDQQQGLNTRGFISGYRGSPLGGLDNTLWQEKQRMEDAGVVFQPGVNEDLAATAVWGTQQLDFFPEPQVDGVYAMWYGKAPGVDRSADAMRHGNGFGTHKYGGVLVVAGDDHPGKSSTVVNQSEPLLRALEIPVLYPSDVQEIIEFGLLGWELSRYCGLWVGLKTTNETVEQTQTVTLNLREFSVQRPDRGLDALNVNIKRTGYNPQAMDVTVKRVRLPQVHKFVRANGIDKTRLAGEGGLGIVTAGKSYSDVMQALSLLGLDAAAAQNLGIAIYKVGCVWPLEPEGLKAFAKGRPELLFVEEKAAMLEPQAAQLFINEDQRIKLVGKQDEQGQILLPSDVQLEPAAIADVIMARLSVLGVASLELKTRHDSLRQSLQDNVMFSDAAPSTTMRTPYFCSGCPHNTSTKVPDGSMAMAGIGCHGIAMMTRSDTLLPSHMGGEGMSWAGAAPFSGTDHMFQNLGDGTYFHSGLMAIRGAVSAGINITYKILYNDAVAMTGGQPIDGPISVYTMVQQLTAESVKQVVVVSDDADKFRGKLPAGIDLHPREELDLVQKQLRQITGTTVLIYEQTCATEKRRRRKRGKFPNPAKRLFINDAVCEGCGDCSVQSTCVSIQPKQTAFGTKRQIDQSSCNKDYSCVNGFCPSFVTVLDAEPKKPSGVELTHGLFDNLPTPAVYEQDNMGVMIAGIGGTGVITVGAIIGMAAHMEGKACSIYDMTGLSQKNGAVYSHLRVAQDPQDLSAQRIGAGEADLILGFDLVASLAGDAVQTYSRGRTRLVGNSAVQATAAFQFDRDLQIDVPQVESQILARTGEDMAWFADATNLALKLMGDTIGSNMFMVGYAAQLGLLPVSVAALEKAIDLNGNAVSFNLTALSLGRLFAHSPDKVLEMLPSTNGDINENNPNEQTLDELIAHRVTHLTAYQNQAWADRYLTTVNKVKMAEHALDQQSEELTFAVADNLAKLMSYKDEYEVARLFIDPAFKQQLDAQFEPGYKLKFNLAPPLISRRHPSTGHLMKREFGGWMIHGYKLLEKLKVLRGTAWDIFGFSSDRRQERALITEYEAMVEQILSEGLSTTSFDQALQRARMPEDIRGYGHVKEQSLQDVGMGRHSSA